MVTSRTVQGTLAELDAAITSESQPLELAELETQGLLIRAGSRWQVPNIRALPQDVASRISELETSDGKTFVRFRWPAGRKKRVDPAPQRS